MGLHMLLILVTIHAKKDIMFHVLIVIILAQMIAIVETHVIGVMKNHMYQMNVNVLFLATMVADQ